MTAGDFRVAAMTAMMKAETSDAPGSTYLERYEREEEKEREKRGKDSVLQSSKCAGRNRRDEIIISRLRFEHTILNSTLYKMGKHNTGKCKYCGQNETVTCYGPLSESILIQNFAKIKMQFKLVDILQK